MSDEIFDPDVIARFPLLMTEAQASELSIALTGHGKPQTLRVARCNGDGAPFVRSGRTIRYQRDKFVEHLRAKFGRSYRSTAEYPPRDPKKRVFNDAEARPPT